MLECVAPGSELLSLTIVEIKSRMCSMTCKMMTCTVYATTTFNLYMFACAADAKITFIGCLLNPAIASSW